MQGKKILFLFLALLLPICVFIFLKIFGKNEFQVKPLFQDAFPQVSTNCLPTNLPYKLNPEIVKSIMEPGDSLGLLYFRSDKPIKDSQNQMARIEKAYAGASLSIKTLEIDSTTNQLRECVLLLNDPYDVVLIDSKGLIRGQYTSKDREEIDRLITEIDIILKRY